MLTQFYQNETYLTNIGKIYLYTQKAEKYYENLGWKLLSKEEYHNNHISIMEYEL